MPLDVDIPREFTTMRGEEGKSRAIVVRPDSKPKRAGYSNRWRQSRGASSITPTAQRPTCPASLRRLSSGDDETRDEAWWMLWGNIHHQGTIYEATVPAVPLLFGLAD